MTKLKGEFRKCLTCNKKIYAYPYQIKNGQGKYCSKKCHGLPRRGIALKNVDNNRRTPWNKGRKFPELSGENSPVWKGGSTPKKIKRLSTPFWKKLRIKIYNRDNYRCQSCNKKCRADIQCHHNVPYRHCNDNENKIIFWNSKINLPENLITLCKSCHMKIERRSGPRPLPIQMQIHV